MGSYKPFEAMRREVDSELSRHFGTPQTGDSLVRQAMRESVTAGGKRLRPIMTMVTARDLGFHTQAALRAGCAVELVHTASLLLDDLPCMDDAAMRRGKPAVHITFGEDVAILASIALLSDAYAMVAGLPDVPGDRSVRMVTSLSEAIGLNGLVSGQYKDLHLGITARQRESEALNDQKTGSLFVTCLDMAAMLAGADASALAALRSYGYEIGRAFQLFDDLLDLDGDAALMGKSTQQDAARPGPVRKLGRAAAVKQIKAHVAAARLSLAGLPVRARGLLSLTDHIFGDDAAPADAHPRAAGSAVMASLLAR
jgi:geranylgeranyl diphosphate synthase, type II